MLFLSSREPFAMAAVQALFATASSTDARVSMPSIGEEEEGRTVASSLVFMRLILHEGSYLSIAESRFLFGEDRKGWMVALPSRIW